MRPPRHATVVAYLALFVALSGTAVAVTRIGSRQIVDNSIRSKDVRNNEVRTQDIRNNEVRTQDIRDGTIAFKDIRRTTIDALKGATGPRGATGPKGDAGPPGAPTASVLVGATGTPVENGSALRAAIASLPPASAEAPRAIQLGAGQYDLNGTGITVPADVTLAGAGQAATIVNSSPANVKLSLVTLEDRANLRDLAVRTASGQLGSVAVDGTPGKDSTLDRVTLSAGVGAILRGGVLRNAEVTAVTGPGVRLLDGGTQNPQVVATRLLVLGTDARGLHASTNFRLRDSWLFVLGADSSATGVRLDTVSATGSRIDDTQISTTAGDHADGIQLDTPQTSPLVEISASQVSASGTTDTALRADRGRIRAAATQLVAGDVSATSAGGTITCFATYDESYAATGC